MTFCVVSLVLAACNLQLLPGMVPLVSAANRLGIEIIQKVDDSRNDGLTAIY